MWKAFKGLFGGKDTANDAVGFATSALTGIGTWIDEKDFTPEERAKSVAEAVAAHLELVKATANENSKRAVTRRWLVAAIVSYVFIWGSVAMIYAIDGNEAVVKRMIDVITALHMGTAFLAAVGFFLGVQFLRK